MRKGGTTKEEKPFAPGEVATPMKLRDSLGRWLPKAKPPGQQPQEAKTPDAEDLKQIERLAALGHGKYAISAKLGIDPKTFARWRKDYPEVIEAYQRGLEEEEGLILGELLRIMKEKDNPAPGIFLLKARHGYREGESPQTDNRVLVQVTLPAALKEGDYIDYVASDTKQITEGGDDG